MLAGAWGMSMLAGLGRRSSMGTRAMPHLNPKSPWPAAIGRELTEKLYCGYPGIASKCLMAVPLGSVSGGSVRYELGRLGPRAGLALWAREGPFRERSG